MEEGATPGRVEIELTARGTGRGRRRRATDVVDPLTTGAVPDRPTSTTGDDPSPDAQVGFAPPLALTDGASGERRRIVLAAAVSGVVALFIGWSLGRATSDDVDRSQAADVATGSTTLTPTVPTVPSDTVGVTVAPVDPALLAETTAFSPIVERTPVSTAVVGWITTTVDVAEPAAALDLDIVGLQPGGTVVELDTATGEMSSIETDARGNFPGALFAGAGWIVVTQSESARAVLLRGHSDPERITLAPAWSLFWQPGTDRFWRLDEVTRFGDPLHITEVNHDGTPTGVEFESDGRYWLAAADPLGGLLVLGAPGGSYRRDAGGTSRITTGDVLALSADKVLVNDCGEAMAECGLIVIDRVSGAASPLTPLATGADTRAAGTEMFDNPANYGFPALMSAISPDGRYSPVIVIDDDPDYGVIDLMTGEFINLGDQPQSSLWWTPDSRTALYLVNSELMAYDFDARSTYEVSADLSPLQDFAVRSAT